MLKFFNSLYNRVYNRITSDLSNILENDDDATLSQVVKNKSMANNACLYEVSLLHKACAKDAFKCLIWLLKIGAAVDLVSDKPKWTPLRYAIENNLESVAFLLIMHGANPDQPESGFKYVTPRSMANPTMQKTIQEAEQLYKSLLSLKAEYENLKTQADIAYKKADINEARKLYQASAGKYTDISKLWENLSTHETNEIFKSYYQEQQEHYLKRAEKLKRALTSTEIYSEQRFDIDKNNHSSQIRQRKIFQKKHQPVSEKQPIQHKLVM